MQPLLFRPFKHYGFLSIFKQVWKTVIEKRNFLEETSQSYSKDDYNFKNKCLTFLEETVS